jgi:hypothetical protein
MVGWDPGQTAQQPLQQKVMAIAEAGKAAFNLFSRDGVDLGQLQIAQEKNPRYSKRDLQKHIGSPKAKGSND